ncbi:MAG TPA: hypothetical protein DEB06_11400 [Phycisphaerales bacterium]|nr:hypothetical protein [Phycisphaerales bacterium]
MNTKPVLSACGTAAGVALAALSPSARAGFTFIQIVEARMETSPWLADRARGLSPEGGVIVGFGSTTFIASTGFRWTRSTPADLGPALFMSGALDASSGGGVVVGFGSGGSARRWTALSGSEPLESLNPLTERPSSARGVSDDGVHIVGQMRNPDSGDTTGFVWESVENGAQVLAPLVGLTQSDAFAVSGDASTIGGTSAGFFPFSFQDIVPFDLFDPGAVCTIWPNDGAFAPEPLLLAPPRVKKSGDALPGRITRLSHDGSVAVGSTFGAPGVVGFIHHRPTSTTLVPAHPHGFGQTDALGVSADGRRVVGVFEGGPAGTGAWLWDARGGSIDLTQFLAARGLPMGFVITEARDISSDGTVIAASGLRDNPSEAEAVLIEIPAPCLGDANGDFVVDFDDITTSLSNWLNAYHPFPGTGPGDADLDGDVDFDDITSELSQWLQDCP